jgi:sulfate transporter 4
VGAAFNCYTTTGSFSRSAVMNDVGAKTQLAGVTSGAFARVAFPPFWPDFACRYSSPCCTGATHKSSMQHP